MRYRCPECGSTTALDVSVSTWARLVDHMGHLETDADLAEFHDHEWGENSVMRCAACDHQDIAERFQTNRRKSKWTNNGLTARRTPR
jgi:predicted RNA-binding Zn-ribbon protein involved in translation (DUF1610 family)